MYKLLQSIYVVDIRVIHDHKRIWALAIIGMHVWKDKVIKGSALSA